MKTHITKSWKTSTCGVLIGIGQFLVLAPLANVRWLGNWTNGDNRHAYMCAGVVLAVAGCTLLASRAATIT